MTRTTFTLDQSEAAELMKPLNGSGGFQSFGRKLQARLDKGSNDIALTDSELGRIVRHMKYDAGTFQNRLRDAFGRHLRDITR